MGGWLVVWLTGLGELIFVGPRLGDPFCFGLGLGDPILFRSSPWRPSVFVGLASVVRFFRMCFFQRVADQPSNFCSRITGARHSRAGHPDVVAGIVSESCPERLFRNTFRKCVQKAFAENIAEKILNVPVDVLSTF